MLAAAAEEADSIVPRGQVGAGAAVVGVAIPRCSKLRLFVTLPDGACAGMLASPLMPVSGQLAFDTFYCPRDRPE